MTQKFDIGETVRTDMTFSDFGDNLGDPTSATCTMRKPDQSVISLTTVRDSLGVYHAETVVDQDGNWWARWDGSGAIDVVEEAMFHVRVRKV